MTLFGIRIAWFGAGAAAGGLVMFIAMTAAQCGGAH